MRSKAKRPVGRPPGRIAPHKPVLSARVPQKLYDAITEIAEKSGRTISEEMVWQLHIALQIDDARKFLSDIEHTTEKALRAKMQQAGLKPFRSAHGTYWFEEGMPPLRLDPDVKAAITEAVRDALKSQKKGTLQ